MAVSQSGPSPFKPLKKGTSITSTSTFSTRPRFGLKTLFLSSLSESLFSIVLSMNSSQKSSRLPFVLAMSYQASVLATILCCKEGIFRILILRLLGWGLIGNRSAIPNSRRLTLKIVKLPINRPICPVMNHNRGGAQQHRIMKGSMNYYPNRNNAGHPVPASEGGYVEYVIHNLSIF